MCLTERVIMKAPFKGVIPQRQVVNHPPAFFSQCMAGRSGRAKSQ